MAWFGGRRGGKASRRGYLGALLEINQRIGAAEPTEALLRAIAEEAARLLDVDNAGFRLVEGDGLVIAGLAGTAAQTMLRPRLRIGESFSGRVVRERRTIMAGADSVPEMVPEHRAADRRLGYTFYLGVPLRAGDRIVGAFTFRARRPFTARHQEVAEAFAGQAAIAIEHARLYQAARRQAERMGALADVERLLSETLDPDVVAQRIADSVRQLLHALSSAVYRLDPASEELVAVAVSGDLGPSFGRSVVFPRGAGASGLALRERRPVVTPDVLSDARIELTAELRERIGAAPYRAVLAIPLTVRERVIGALGVGDGAGRAFDEEDVRLAQAFADQAALALDNARLHEETERRRLEAEERLRETTTLLAVGRVLSEPLPTQETMRRVAREVALAFGADTVGACMLEERSRRLVPFAGYRVPAQLLDLLREEPIAIEQFALLHEAWRSGRVVGSADVHGDERFHRTWVERLPPHAVLFAPTQVRGQSVGGLFLIWWRVGRVFTPGELRLIEGIAAQVGLALENAELARQREAKLRETETLLAVSRALSATLDLDALLRHFMRQIVRAFAADSVGIWMVEDGEWLAPAHGYHVPPERLPAIRQVRLSLVHHAFYADAARAGQPAFSADVAADPRLPAWLVEAVPHRSQLFVPILAKGRLMAAFIAVWWTESRPFSEGELALLAGIANQAGVAIENARLFAENRRQVEELSRLFEERTRAYGELAAAQDHLVRTEKLRVLGEMASGVAHDFNNLLAAILGRAQLLRRRLEDPELRQWLEVIERAAVDGAQTVRRLQEFARVRRDQPRVPVDVNEVARDALEMTQARWREDALRRGVAIEVRAELPPVPLIAGDPAELREALTNLILNAVDAMPTGGTLTLASAAGPGQVEVAVSDTGVGIPESVRPKIFDPFFTTKGPQGTGLGLAMTYGIVARHGGTISVESEEGRGSTFRIAFPVAEAPSASAGPVPPVAPPPGGLRCLVVDDEEVVATLIGDVLRTAGHEAVVLTDGAAAIDRVRAEPFDVVFTDLAMPGVSGWQVARAAREAAPGVPVFVVTGFGAEVSAEERWAHGVEAILAKPLKIEAIVDAVEQIARRRAPITRPSPDRRGADGLPASDSGIP